MSGHRRYDKVLKICNECRSEPLGEHEVLYCEYTPLDFLKQIRRHSKCHEYNIHTKEEMI